jgi:hypothetical protein
MAQISRPALSCDAELYMKIDRAFYAEFTVENMFRRHV